MLRIMKTITIAETDGDKGLTLLTASSHICSDTVEIDHLEGELTAHQAGMTGEALKELARHAQNLPETAEPAELFTPDGDFR